MIWNQVRKTYFSAGYHDPLHQVAAQVYTCVVWNYKSLENNFGKKDELINYSRETCWFVSDQYFTIKYFMKIAFVIEISVKESGGLVATGMDGLRI